MVKDQVLEVFRIHAPHDLPESLQKPHIEDQRTALPDPRHEGGQAVVGDPDVQKRLRPAPSRLSR